MRLSLLTVVRWAISIFFLMWFVLVGMWLGRLTTYVRRKEGRRPRILWGSIPVLTISKNSRAERRFGYKSETIVYETYYLSEEFDYNLEKYARIGYLSVLIPWLVFHWAVLKYDVFQFFFDRGLLFAHGRRGFNRLELPLLKLAGKIVIVSAYGGDVRYERKSREGGDFNCCIDCDQKMIACMCDEWLAMSNVDYVNRYADMTLSMGDMVDYTPGSRNDVFYWSIDLDRVGFVGVREQNDPPIVIVHAPNHRQFKGTKYLIEAVGRLREKGYLIDLKFVEGIGNERALELYKQADIVAEQFIIGWHGYLAVEGMALGKPVVSFIRSPETYFPKDQDCPIVNANPDNLEERLTWLIENPQIRAELAVKGRAYVKEVFSSKRVGERLDQIYQSMWAD